MNMPTVLIVDESPSARMMLVKRLEVFGYVVEMVEGGLEALRLLKVFHPEIVLVDHALSDIDGFEVALEIASSAETSHIPVIMMTSTLSKGFIARARAYGAKTAISKQSDAELLNDAIRMYLPYETNIQQDQDNNQELKKMIENSVAMVSPAHFADMDEAQGMEQLIHDMSKQMNEMLEGQIKAVVDEALQRSEFRLVEEIPRILDSMKPVLENAITDMSRSIVTELVEANIENVMEQYAQQLASSMVRSIATLRREPSEQQSSQMDEHRHSDVG